MTTLWPSGRSLPLRLYRCRNKPHARAPHLLEALGTRCYASRPSHTSSPDPRAASLNNSNNNNNSTTSNDLFLSALQSVQGKLPLDPINPPRSTIPPPISFPIRSEEKTFFTYLYRIGRAYLGFYKNGVKAVYYNRRAAKLLQTHLESSHGIRDVGVAVQKGFLKRSEFQLLERNRRDVGKAPIFGLLFLVFGEWLPLLVPFIPGAVPGTCRIPKQVEGMRTKAEARRRVSFRSGIPEPVDEGRSAVTGKEEVDAAVEWPMAFDPAFRTNFLRSIRADQLLHISTTLNLHGNLWTRLQLPPPTFLLRPRISRRLAYLAQDDLLLRAQSSNAAAKLSLDEVKIACEERGMDIQGQYENKLRHSLDLWLRLQKRDRGEGRILRKLLFRRPNVWEDLERDVKSLKT